MFKSLRMKIVLILTLLIIAVMLVVGTFIMSNITTFYNNDFKTQMEQVFINNKSFREGLDNALESQDPSGSFFEVLNAYSGALGIDSYRNFYVLDGNDGTYITGSASETDTFSDSTSNLIHAMRGEIGDEVDNLSAYFDYAYPVKADNGFYIIYIKDTKQELQEMTWIIFAIIVQALLFGLVIAIGMSFFLASAITNPVEEITKGAQLMASGKFTHTLPVKSKDEIGTLTQTFNSMAGVLQKTMDEIDSERNKLETIFFYLTDGVAAFTKDKRLLHINRAANELLENSNVAGDTFEDVFGKVSDINFDEILLSRELSLIKEIHIGDKILEVIFGKFDPQEVENNVFSGGIIAVIHDITERQMFELSRREFVANVSHELRTPLTSIKSYTETVLETPDLPKNLLYKFLSVVINETDRMTRIVKDLLVLSRLDNNKMDWVFIHFDMGLLLSNINDSMLMDAKKHDHELVFQIENELGMVLGDKERIEQVIINIISNAIKYTPDGGRIVVSIRRCGEDMKITVRDNGIGIPKEDIPRLYERFYRVDKARSRERGGTGLGLAIAREIIMAHHGSIEIESEIDVGTTVTVMIPCDQEE